MTLEPIRAALAVALAAAAAAAQDVRIVKQDYQIDGGDPGIRLFVRFKVPEGKRSFGADEIVLFVHGATFPSTPDFDLQYKDYSWADVMARRGYAVYMFDERNYGGSTREAAMDAPAASHPPVSRSYQVIRDIGAVVDHIRAKHEVPRVTLIGWSWGAMTAGFYASLHPEKVNRLVLYAPLYDYPQHTNLGAGTGLQNKRRPFEFNDAMGAYRLSTAEANQKRWDGEIPVDDKSQYREQAVVDAFNEAALATDPTSKTRSPPSLRAPNGVLEDSFLQATGRPLWSATSVYAPTLVVAGEYDTWSYPDDREGLMRDLVHAPLKRSVLIREATHFVLFEKNRRQLYDAVFQFLEEPLTAGSAPGH